MSQAYLLTGEPGTGKTRTIKRIVDAVGREHCGGFYTEEIREQGTRVGFRLVTLDGQQGVLAHVNSDSPLRVGRYGVSLDALESIGIAAIAQARVAKRLIVIDEIGPMEVYSALFRRTVMDILTGLQLLLGTIALRSHPWLDVLKQHAGVELFPVTLENQPQVIENIISLLKHSTPQSIGKS